MKPNKSKKIILIIIIVMLLLILLSGFAFAYFSTDLLKNDKELFFKYAMQTISEENGFIEEDLITYLKNKKEKAYSNNGRFYANIDIPEQDMKRLEYTNKMDISFSGEVDNNNSKLEQEFSINYSDNVKLPFSFKKENNTIGLMQSQYISKKYLTLNLNSLEEINNNNSFISVDNVKNGINQVGGISNINFSKQEIENLQDTYSTILKENIPNNEFSSSNENGEKAYILKTNSRELSEVAIQLLEKLKTDSIILNKINESSMQNNSSKITSESIDDLIDKIRDLKEISSLKIKIYQQNGKTSKIYIKNENIDISIEKVKNKEGLQYNILVNMFKNSENESSLFLNVKYNGLEEMDVVKESYQFGIEFNIGENDEQSEASVDSYKYQYNLENEISFKDTIQLEDFSKDNSFSLSDLNEEKRNNMINTISQRLTSVNKKQMEELGLNENSNPMINMIPLVFIHYSLGENIQNETLNELEEAEISNFNSKFELYEGANIGGGTVKGLLTVIASNNKLDDDESEISNTNSNVNLQKENLIKEINFNGEEYQVNKQTIAVIKGEILTEDNFRVEFEKDENTGRIFRAVINKK